MKQINSYTLFCKNLHLLIIAKMKNEKISQSTLAKKMGKSQSTISETLKRLENGKDINLNTIFFITETLGIKLILKS